MHFGTAQCKQRGPALSECNESKGFAHIFALVGVLVVILVVGEVYYFGYVKSVKIPKTEQSVPVISNKGPEKQEPEGNGLLQSPKITSAKQPESNDYLNSELGFGFKFAKDLNVKADSEEEFNKRGNGDFRKNFKGYVGYEPGKVLGIVAVLDQTNSFDNNPLTLWVFENPDNLTTEDWFTKYWYYPFLWGVFDYTSKGHITPDTEATISGILTKYKIVSYQPGSPKYFYLVNNGKMYLFRIIGELGNQILSTFRFIQ